MNGSTVLSSKARVLDALRDGLVRHRDVILLRLVPAVVAAGVLVALTDTVLGEGSTTFPLDALVLLAITALTFEIVLYRYRHSANPKGLGTVLMRLIQGLVAVATAAGALGDAGTHQVWIPNGVVCVFASEVVIYRMRLDGKNLASLFLRFIQLWLFVGFFIGIAAGKANFGLWIEAALFGLVFEGIIFRLRPDPRPPVLEDALRRVQQEVAVYTQLPIEKVKETLGMVRGISDIQADSGLEFELAEQEALYLMLKQAKQMGANAVVDARLSIGTYEVTGSKWQVSRPVYTGTAVRI
jgi:uncharacterized protein YbjQ (UPF0145 family)